jgi:hypothetical protein
MRKWYHTRRKGIKKPKRQVRIVCEGKKAEKEYFIGLMEWGGGVKIIAIHGGCTDPMGIVKYAEERMDKWSINLDEGDEVWCVFDVDESTTQILSDVYAHAKTKNIKIALSNPCFELWFLLHYKPIFSQISRQDVIKELKILIKGYKKDQNINHLLKDKLSTAISNAKKLNEVHKKSSVPLISKESNPSTQVFELVKFIQELIKKNKMC